MESVAWVRRIIVQILLKFLLLLRLCDFSSFKRNNEAQNFIHYIENWCYLRFVPTADFTGMCWRNLNCLRKCSTVNKDFNQNKNNSQLSTVNSKRKCQISKKKKKEKAARKISNEIKESSPPPPLSSCQKLFLSGKFLRISSIYFDCAVPNKMKCQIYIYRRHILYYVYDFCKISFHLSLIRSQSKFQAALPFQAVHGASYLNKSFIIRTRPH